MKKNKNEFEANEQKLEDNLTLNDEKKKIVKDSLFKDKKFLNEYLITIGRYE